MTTPARSGVFDSVTDRRVEEFTESVSFDRRLYAHDIRGSIAHAEMLATVGILTADEAGLISQALGEIGERIAAGKFVFQDSLEDIHMHIEQALIDQIGDVGRKLHTGRSRNDQVSTATRLWIRDALARLDQGIADLQGVFLGRCDQDTGVILPAYTHLQRAQPVLASHYWLAYCEKFQRDRDRLTDCQRRVNTCSLGSAAVAGTSIPIDREDVARRLGFQSLSRNSLDVSSDRDFVLETAFVLTMVAEHLSNWAEEWILWSTVEFDYLALPHQFCTGSSIMPQKINPDVLELIRGKTGRVVGNLQSLLVLVKGLPLAYNRDLQEDKPALFDSFDTVESCLQLAVPIVAGAELKRGSIETGLERGYLDATTLMEYLIQHGVPMRSAHHAVGQLVNKARQHNVPLGQLGLSDFQECHADLDESVFEVLGVERAIQSFSSYGSTAPAQVERQIADWKRRLAGDMEAAIAVENC
ncbi:MAG: argininosuccinate lyase [Planctomycetota bacterium]|nr:argininosuccinate lyase [Planctomycetota bacterium]